MRRILRRSLWAPAVAVVLLALCAPTHGRATVEERTSRAASRPAPRVVSRTGADSQQSRKARLDVASLSQRSSKRSKARHLGRISLAGAISCSLTHCLVVPLDVIKTRMQTDASASGMRQAAAAIFSAAPGKGPMRGLAFFNGVGATATGYWMQGAAKFGGYEALKHVAFKHIRALPNGDALADRWRLPVMISAAFGAEGVASTFLCPLEVLKLRLQTDPACAARGLTGALRAVVRTEGVGALFKGLSAICLRQLPYTAVKLVSYELFAQLLLAAAVKAGFEAGSARLERARPVLALGSGLLAGACAALASQPADLLLTRICGGASVAALSSCVIADNVVDQVRYLFSIGLRECYAGVGPRLTMVASMTAVQFLLYDLLRLRLGVAGPVPG